MLRWLIWVIRYHDILMTSGSEKSLVVFQTGPKGAGLERSDLYLDLCVRGLYLKTHKKWLTSAREGRAEMESHLSQCHCRVYFLWHFLGVHALA
jgi:hypothetical protein